MRHPDRPDILVANHAEVYRYFANNERSAETREKALAGFSRLIVPELEWVDGAKEELQEVIDNDQRVMFLMNHTNNFDSMMIGGLFWTDPLLRRLSGTVRIAGKFSLFNRFSRFADVIEDIGTVPIPRTKDLEKEGVTPAVLKAATDDFFDLFDASVRKEKGEDWILFPGGTRNKKDRATMPAPQAGAARMLTRANDLEKPLVTVCIGDYHPPRGSKLRTLNKPSIVIGRPDSTRWTKKSKATAHIQEQIQTNLTRAYANSLARQ